MREPRICNRCLREFYTPEDVEPPKLHGPKHKPIGTFYTVEDAVADPPPPPPPERPAHPTYLEGGDVGPPAPGEGDDLPNPEMEVEC